MAEKISVMGPSLVAVYSSCRHNLALSLMLVNRQFYADVQKVLQLFGTNYHVDIMFVKDRGFWTTWTIPTLPKTQYIDSVHATFRIFEPTEDLDEKFRNSLYLGPADGGPSGGLWGFYRMLVALLQSGPASLGPQPKDWSTPYAVKRISIDVLSPTDGVTHRSLAASNEELRANPFWFLARRINFVLHNVQLTQERRLVSHMVSGFEIVWNLRYQSINHGTLLFEAVRDTVDFLLNGKLHMRFDVAERMRTMEKPVPRLTATSKVNLSRKKSYRKWWKWLQKRRNQMDQGLEFDPKRPRQDIFK
ncbi:unnamed protein product [Clonostachys rosea]|uniref:HNH nuclease domain-containing protein n=1 Tax=Bionectria ochroleuca TaxID=29856 RepID=A0ABY6V4Q9_BIOOC|nr:unnamed protein product [Clonostachys rosea]